MKFETKNTSTFNQLIVTEGNVSMSSGLLDEGEAMDIAEQLIDAAIDILPFHENKKIERLINVRDTFYDGS